MIVAEPQVSEFLPPKLREALVAAGRWRDTEAIDHLTDFAAERYPKLVLPRTTLRPEFVSVAVGRRWAEIPVFVQCGRQG